MIPELTLSGPPRQRGRAHGEALRERIAGAIDAWFGHLSERTEPEDFVADLYHRSGLRTGVGRHAPGLLQEVEGIAEASNQPIETMLAWQFVDETWWYLDKRTRVPQLHERCSAVAVNHAGTGIVAQTMDLPWHLDGTQNDGPVVTAATMIFELGDEPVCHFAPGPLDSEELVSYGFRTGA